MVLHCPQAIKVLLFGHGPSSTVAPPGLVIQAHAQAQSGSGTDVVTRREVLSLMRQSPGITNKPSIPPCSPACLPRYPILIPFLTLPRYLGILCPVQPSPAAQWQQT